MKRMPSARPTSQWEKACSEKYANSRLKIMKRVPWTPSRSAYQASVAAPSNPPICMALPCATERVSQGVTRLSAGIRPPSCRDRLYVHGGERAPPPPYPHPIRSKSLAVAVFC